ncbi:kinase-like domain-containing protein [Gigaspora rosea]|uniref:Kinase-like domain-containing protein n=1 Tax=Gigaspora rosea TaxID=44941 RepID=A0A397U650_9GLOM|nr:kinase-like domain-containing protein [Gigaspora rosea]
MPYVAPEVLLGQKFTKAADIYSFGVIMSEMSTGQRPFDGQEFDHKLAIKICKGLRPEFASGTPDCYIELANQCMNLDPQKRPTANDLWNILEKWIINIESSNSTNESLLPKESSLSSDEQLSILKIKKQFLEADEVIKSLPIPKHSDEMYTSKIIKTKLISKAIKGVYFN